MAHGDSLALTIEATQRSLQERLGEALAPHRDPRRGRERFAATDSFLAATSRHVGAAEAVLLPAACRIRPEGDAMVHRYLAVAKRLERTMALLKARLYGGAQAVSMPWPALWSRVQSELTEHNRLETELVEELILHGDHAEVDGLARRLFDAETHGPTRPHPYLPHTGLLGRVSRRVWASADRFWDTAEGRVIAEPVRPRQHTHDSLMAQYLVADPHFDVQARMLAQRTRRRRGRTTT